MNRRLIIFLIFFLFIFNLFPALATASITSPVSSEWSYTVEGKTYSSPVAANKMVYFYSDAGIVHAIDALDGKSKWKHEIKPEPKEKLGGSVTVEGGMVYAVLNDGRLIALNAFSGEVEWSYNKAAGRIYPPIADYFYYTAPVAINDNLVCLTAPDGTLHALDKNGKQRWTYRPENTFISSPPFIYENTVCAGAVDGTVCAVKANTGKPIWTFKCDDGIFFSPFVLNKTVYVGSKDKKIYALDVKKGGLEWSYKLENEVGGPPTVLKDTAYVSSNNGELIALNATDGELKWVFYVKGFLVSSPILDDFVVYVGSNDGNFYALDSKSGDTFWVYDTEGYFVTHAAFAKEMIYVAASVKEKGESSLKIFAFKRGLSPGMTMTVIGRKGSVSIKKTVGQINDAADHILSDFGESTVNNVSIWPFGFVLRLVEHSKVKEINSVAISKAEKEASKTVLRYTPATSIVGFICGAMMTPIASITVLASIVCFWAVLVIFFLYVPIGKMKPAAIMLFTESSTAEHSSRGGYFKALKRTLTNYVFIMISFLAGSLVLLISWAAVNYFYPIYDLWLLYFLIGLMWLLVLLVGSFVRALGFGYVLKVEGITDAPFKIAKSAFGRILLVSLWHIILMFSSAFCFGLAQTQHSYLVFGIALILVFLAILTFFADAFVIIKNKSVSKAILSSIKLSFKHPLKVGIYVITMGLIFILASLAIHSLLKISFGYIVSLAICAIVTSYLTNLHGLIFFKIAE
ncbi:MAG TPA: hypothetical protein ENN38_06985 [Actinobacteria bacterium]|nr:hypothetical protein [Actinomycetota bacterium]